MNLEITVTKTPNINPEVLYDGAKAAMYESTGLAEKEVRQRAPVGVGGQSGFRGSVFSEVREFPSYLQGITSSPLPYAEPLEFGRQAGARMPPVAALIPWVEKFITLSKGDTAKGVAFAIARYISIHGTAAWRQSPPGVRMFEQGLLAAQPNIEAAFERMVGEVSTRVLTD